MSARQAFEHSPVQYNRRCYRKVQLSEWTDDMFARLFNELHPHPTDIFVGAYVNADNGVAISDGASAHELVSVLHETRQISASFSKYSH